MLAGSNARGRIMDLPDDASFVTDGAQDGDIEQGRDWQRINWIMIHVSKQ